MFTLKEMSLHALALSLVDKAVEMKPTPRSYVSHRALQHEVLEMPYIFSNDLMRVITDILRRIRRDDCLPLVSHPACDSFAITANECGHIPVIFGNIGFLKGLKTLKLKTHGDGSRYSPFVEERSRRRCLNALAMKIRFLHNLTVIHLPYVCTSEILGSITECCPLLEDLNIQESEVDIGDCCNISKCQKLKYLNINGVSIEEDIAPTVAYLVQQLTDLRSIAHFDILRVLDAVIHTATITGIGYEYSLESATFGYREEPVDLHSLLLFFPHLKKIDHGGAMLGSDIRNLNMFPELTSLVLYGGQQEDLLLFFTEAEGKYKQLELCGIETAAIFRECDFSNLLSLELIDCTGVDFIAINKTAPNLKKFKVESCTGLAEQPRFEKGKAAFENLLELSISDTDISAEEAHFLLDSCDDLRNLHLEEIFISNSDEDAELPFSSELFRDCVNMPKKEELKSVKIINIGPISDIVKYLVQNFTSLKP